MPVTNVLTKLFESLGASWRGYERLWVVFWIYYVPVVIVLGFLPEDPPNAWYLWVPITIVPLIWLVWIMVSLWRCAYATDYRILGHLVRLNVFFGVVVALFYLYWIAVGILTS